MAISVMSNLFDLTTFVEVARTNQPRVKTPLGPLVLEVIVLEQRGAKQAHKHFIDDDNQGEAFVFSFEEASTELLICPTKTWLPNGMTIEQCLGCVLRVRARVDNLSLSFSCKWPDEVSPPDGGGDNGEYLTALTWNDEKTAVSLGTADEEYLLWRVGKELPFRWKQQLSASDCWDVYVQNVEQCGAVIATPGLMKGESCEIYFKIAWAEYSEERPSTWFAVDVLDDTRQPWWPGQEPFRSSISSGTDFLG